MKKIIRNTIYLGMMAMAFISCQEEWLETVKYKEATEESYYRTDEQLELASTALYNSIRGAGYNLMQRKYCSWMGADAYQDRKFQTDMNDLTYDHGSGGYAWNDNYRGILIANKLLLHVEDEGKYQGTNETLEKRVIAEAKFMRAFYYFDLAKFFGRVPLTLTPLSTEDYGTLKRAPVIDVYKQIIKDLEEAQKDLPLKSEVNGQLGRATKGAAAAMLMRVYVTQASTYLRDAATSAEDNFYDSEGWAKAKKVFEDFFVNGAGASIYSLEPDYTKIFTEEGKNGSGSIFETQYMNSNYDPNGFGGNHFMKTLFPRTRPSLAKGYALPNVTYDLYMEFEDGDVRRDATIMSHEEYIDIFKYVVVDVAGIVDDMALDFDWVTTHLFDRKIYIDPITLINMDGNMKNAPVNERHIRLSDLYLLYAEACVYAGGDAEGYLNKVRRRAELTGDWAGSSDILERIYHERRVELGSEPGTGWPDLKRTGRWKDTDLSYRVSAKVTRVFDGVTPPLGVRYEITGVEQEDVGTPKDDGLDFSGPTGETGVWIQEDYINEIPYKARTWYLPIPELEISNYGLEQNPGW